MPTEDPHAFVDVLAEEEQELADLLRKLDDAAWENPTPARGWSVRDSVSHLADTEEIARDTVLGGPRTLAAEAALRPAKNGVIDYGVARGRAMTAGEVREWWIAAAAGNREALRSVDTSSRIPWGLGMRWRTFVTARLMECWAHGLDIRAGVGAPSRDTARLQHIGWLSYSTLPYAFRIAKVEPPADRTLRIEIVGPAGEHWSYGDPDATDLVSGPAGIWCRRAVQRMSFEDAKDQLVAEGPLAALAVRYARAFL